MTDRHLLGDVALAIVLALPAAALARPAEPAQTRQHASKATPVDTSYVATSGRFDRLFG